MPSPIERLRKPPLDENDTNQFVWKKWFDAVHLQVYNEVNPNDVVTADRTLALGFFIPVDATSAAITISLPASSRAKAKKYFIKKIDASANVVTVDCDGTDLIDGAGSYALNNQWDAIFIESDGVGNWYVLGSIPGGGGGTITTVTAEDETIIIGGGATTPTVRSNTTDILEASEDITGGMWVNVFNSAGTPKVRKADATLGQGYHCVGFVVDTVTTGNTVKIYTTGINSHVTGMTPGDVWLGTAGLGTNTPPSTSGYISQQIGVATGSTEVAFEPQEDILIGPTPTSGGGLILKDEGVTLGPINTLNIVGAPLTATISGTDGTITGTGTGGSAQTLYVYFP